MSSRALVRRIRPGGLGDVIDTGVVDTWVYSAPPPIDMTTIDPFNPPPVAAPDPYWPTMPANIGTDPFTSAPTIPGITPGTQLVSSPGQPFTLDLPTGIYTGGPSAPSGPSWIQSLLNIGGALLTKAVTPAPKGPLVRPVGPQTGQPATAGIGALLSGSTLPWVAAAAVVGYVLLNRGGSRRGSSAYRGRRRRRR